MEPLCYDKADNGTLTPKTPEEILALKVCDPACGRSSFLVAALHYLTDALYKSLCHHCGSKIPKRAGKITLPFGRPKTERIRMRTGSTTTRRSTGAKSSPSGCKALLRRHMVERCIYGVDINPLAIEFARVSLWVETLDLNCRSRFSITKSRSATPWSAAGLIGLRTTRSRRGSGRAAMASNGEAHPGGSKSFSRGEDRERRSGDGRIKREMREVIESRSATSRLYSPT